MAANLAHIAEPLRGLAIPVADLHLDPANARRHGDRNVEAIAASLSRWGQRAPLVVQRDGMVVRAGNGRLEAAKRLGWTYVAALVVDEGSVEATAFAIADNRTAELAEWDDEALAALLDSMNGDVLAATGFQQGELEAMMEALTPPTEEDWAAQFEREGDTSVVDGIAQITFVLGADDMTSLRDVLRRYDPNKNKAMAKWLAASS